MPVAAARTPGSNSSPCEGRDYTTDDSNNDRTVKRNRAMTRNARAAQAPQMSRARAGGAHQQYAVFELSRYEPPTRLRYEERRAIDWRKERKARRSVRRTAGRALRC